MKSIQFNKLAPHTLLKPLVISISSCLLFACASTPKANNDSQSVKPSATVSSAPIPTYTPKTKVRTSTTSSQSTYAGVLDQATLDELEDLLQATDMSMVEGDKLSVQRYGNLWDRVRRGYRMSHMQNSRIEAQKSWFYSRQDYLNRLAARTSRYLYHTVTEAERRGIPTELALLPIIESSYDPSATSNAAAAGLWQFIPSTGRIYGLNQSTTYDGRRDIIESTRAAYDFLTSLYNQFGSWELALAAYNAGPGRIQRAINANRNAGLPTDYWSLRLPTETMNYVPRFMAVAQIVAAPESYGVYLPAIANHSHFRAVPANFGVSLYDVSSVTGVPVDELRLLNPALINFSVDSSGPGRVIVPNSVSAALDSRLTSLRGYGYGASTYTASDSYVVPKMGTNNKNDALFKELASANTLPTTSVQITPQNTIIQEPPLSSEERDFIAAQIQANTIENVEPISSDGNIELVALQTGQSVLEARGEIKSLSFNAPSTTVKTVEDDSQSNNPTGNIPTITEEITKVTTTTELEVNSPNKPSSLSKPEKPTAVKAQSKPETKPTQPKVKSDRYKVVAGDTLSGIAEAHGLSVSQLASYNNISATTHVRAGQRLWLVPGKATTIPMAPKTTSASAKTTIYVVQSGESLTSIARKYNTTVQDLAALNGLSVTDGVLVGQKLQVPSDIKAPVKTQTTKIETKPSDAKSDVKASNQSVKYTIQSGDSLTSVSTKYGITVDELAVANNLDRNAKLIHGKILTVPASGIVKVPAKPQSKSETKPKVDPKTEIKKADKKEEVKTEVAKGKVIKNTENYTVQSGDTLAGLAKKHNVVIADLAATNHLSTQAQLKRGQVIKVPVSAKPEKADVKKPEAKKQTTKENKKDSDKTTTYTVKSGDNLTSVAKHHGISVAELAKLNKLDSNAALKSGQKLIVPKK